MLKNDDDILPLAAGSRVQSRTVVVLHNGSPVTMPWIRQVPAILEMYLGGDGVGAAAIDLLFGRANPGGRLAEAFPLRLADTPAFLNFPGEKGRVDYREGIYVGYRYYDKKEMDVLF
ncbi:MAG TPA: glycosyl hydrolase, partial [Clostridiales bacterium]|nr:glycosyl hydrolase [Clostridiales bacterium]